MRKALGGKDTSSLFLVVLDDATTTKSISLPFGVQRIVARFVGIAHVGAVDLKAFRAKSEFAVSMACPDSAVTVQRLFTSYSEQFKPVTELYDAFGENITVVSNDADKIEDFDKTKDADVLIAFQSSVVALRLSQVLPLPVLSTSKRDFQGPLAQNQTASSSNNLVNLVATEVGRMETYSLDNGFSASKIATGANSIALRRKSKECKSKSIAFDHKCGSPASSAASESSDDAYICESGLMENLEVVQCHWDQSSVNAFRWSNKWQYGKRMRSFGGGHQPNGVALDSVGRVYIADSVANGIIELDQRKGVNATQRMLTIADRLRYPTDVAVSSTDELFVADRDNDRICVFDSDRRCEKRTFPTPSGPPFRLAVDDRDHVFVLNGARTVVAAHAFSGAPKGSVTITDYYDCTGPAPLLSRCNIKGKMTIPNRSRLAAKAICVDRKQHLYVAVTKMNEQDEQWLFVFEYF